MGGAVAAHATSPSEFGQTHALGTAHRLSDWSFDLGAPLQAGDALLLATDGVSDDLVPERVGDLIAWLTGELAQTAHPGRSLARELRAWPVPKHLDDKTLVVLWR